MTAQAGEYRARTTHSLTAGSLREAAIAAARLAEPALQAGAREVRIYAHLVRPDVEEPSAATMIVISLAP